MRWFAQPRPWLLLASLAVNIFFVAAIGASLAFDQFGKPHYPPPVRHLLRAAGDEAKPQIDRALEARRDETRAAVDRLKQSREDFRRAMTADPVDLAGLQASMDARTAARIELSRLMGEVLLEVAPTLPQEKRQELVDRPWRRKKDRDREKDD